MEELTQKEVELCQRIKAKYLGSNINLFQIKDFISYEDEKERLEACDLLESLEKKSMIVIDRGINMFRYTLNFQGVFPMMFDEEEAKKKISKKSGWEIESVREFGPFLIAKQKDGGSEAVFSIDYKNQTLWYNPSTKFIYLLNDYLVVEDRGSSGLFEIYSPTLEESTDLISIKYELETYGPFIIAKSGTNFIAWKKNNLKESTGIQEGPYYITFDDKIMLSRDYEVEFEE